MYALHILIHTYIDIDILIYRYIDIYTSIVIVYVYIYIYRLCIYAYTGWWFGTYIGNHSPNWLILFRGVATTNQYLDLYDLYIYTDLISYDIITIMIMIDSCDNNDNMIWFDVTKCTRREESRIE